MGPIPIPARLARVLPARHGDRGRSWLRELPQLLDRAAAHWDLAVGEPFDPGGTTAWTGQVVRPDGTEAVLKVHFSAEAAAHEAAALRRWDGDGAVRLLDESAGALLLELLVPGERLDALNDFEAEDIVVTELLGRLHRPAPPASALPRMANVMGERGEETTRRFLGMGKPIGRRMVERAVALHAELAEGYTVLHGDVQPGNVLRGDGRRYLAIDPAPMVGDPTYDLVQHLLFRGGSLDDRASQWPHYIVDVARLAGFDPERLRAWMFAKLVHDGLWLGEQGDPGWRHHIEVAEVAWRLSLRPATPPIGPVDRRSIPAVVGSQLKDSTWTIAWKTTIGATWRLDTSGERPRYLKTRAASHGRWSSLRSEAARMRWARSVGLPAPEVLDVGGNGRVEWLLTLALPGTSAWNHHWQHERAGELAAAFGRALRVLHDVPPERCPFDARLDIELARRRHRHAAGRLEWDSSHPDAQTVSLDHALDRLEATRPSSEDLVVTHGDYSAPQVLLDDAGRLTGLVDLGSLGVADRWRDLALGTWYAVATWGDTAEHSFLDAYGIDRDDDLIAYYRLLYSLD